jgi:poly(3-hydroxybutyrate) depolymerase
MRNLLVSIVLGIVVAAGACSDASSPGSPTTHGSTSSTTSTGVGGSTGSTTAGPTTSSSTTSGTSTTGAAGSGGSSAGSGGAGGTASGDASVSDSGKGGSSVSDASFGDASRPVMPSAGCGKMNPTIGNRTIMTGGQMGTYIVKIPTGYNGTTPTRLGFGFHGSGNPACDPTAGGECQGFPQLPAVTVYMKSLPGSPGWEQANVLEPNITFFQDVLAVMKNEFCIDQNHIFVAGVSSGGQFVEYLACRFGDWLWQITPVSASVVNAANVNCKGTPPILVIHGVTDMAGNYGHDVAAMFARRNGCSAMDPPGYAQAKTDMMAAFNAMQAQHVCLDWPGCTANPVRFCISSQITYSGLTHGWPKVGGQLISEFQATIP